MVNSERYDFSGLWLGTILKKSKITYQKPNVIREIRRGMIFLDFGLGMLLLWEVNIEASILLLGAILTFLTVVTILKKSRITYQKPNVVRDGARLTIKYKKKGPPGMSNDMGMYVRRKTTTNKKKRPPGMSTDKGVYKALNLDSSDDSKSSRDKVLKKTAQLDERETEKERKRMGNNRSHPGKFRRDEEPSLCPTTKLKALELSSSDSEILDSNKKTELEKETTRPKMPAGVLPSAPPLFGTNSFLPSEERKKLQMAFPVFDRGKGHACYSTLLKGLECLGL
ncbi:putative Retrovirus-related Gag polyprotein [Cricetulus griseus]|nr:putative Retrovirus-related Gag polyprotein [Cricetulus griseus]